MYVSLEDFDEVQRLSTTGGVTLTISTKQPYGIALDNLGSLYAASLYLSAVTEATPAPGATSATSSTLYTGLSTPVGVVFDGVANLYIACRGSSSIVQITTGGTYVRTLQVSSGPVALTFDTFGNLYATTSAGSIVKFAGVLDLPPSNGATYSDPFFSGFWNQPYYVLGQAGSVYSLLSDAHMQLNARLVFRSNVSCPVLPANERAKVHCSSHPGTYYGEFGLRSAVNDAAGVGGGGGGDELYVRSGPVDVGFLQVTVNGQPLAVGESFGTAPPATVPHKLHTYHAMAPASDAARAAVHPARSSLYVHRASYRSLVVHAGLYELLIENSDLYVDLVRAAVTDWDALLHTVQPSGLLGASWNKTAHMPPAEELHRERDDHLMGCNTLSDKFCSASQQQAARQ